MAAASSDEDGGLTSESRWRSEDKIDSYPRLSRLLSEPVAQDTTEENDGGDHLENNNRDTGVPVTFDNTDDDLPPTTDVTDNHPGYRRAPQLHRPHNMPVCPITKDSHTSDIIFILISISLFAVGLVSDIYVAVSYHQHGDVYWFLLTTLFMVVAYVVTSLFSLAMYVVLYKTAARTNPERTECLRKQLYCQAALHCLPLAPISRDLNALRLIWRIRSDSRDRRSRRWEEEMLYEKRDAALLRIFETFLGNAPMMVLQFYMLTSCWSQHSYLATADDWHDWHLSNYLYLGKQVASIVTSLASLSWAICGWYRAELRSDIHKPSLLYTGLAAMMIWRVFDVGSRVIAVAIMATCLRAWLTLPILIHASLMLIWLICTETNFFQSSPPSNDSQTEERVLEYFFKATMVIVYIFTFMNVCEGQSRWRRLIYYTLVYGENVAMVTPWVVMKSLVPGWYKVSMSVGVYTGVPVAAIIMFIYYRCCHHKRDEIARSDAVIHSSLI